MDYIMYKDRPIDSLLFVNIPSYVQQNVYGRLRYYPVLEPVTDVSVNDLKEPKIVEAAKRFKSTEEVVKAFFEWNPPTTGGKLTDSREIQFLGYKYIYHPNHKTYYGNVDREYLILPAIMRWYVSVKDEDRYNFSPKYIYPRGYQGGESRGFKYYIMGAETKESAKNELPIEAKSEDKYYIPLTAKDSVGRVAALMCIHPAAFKNLDECCMVAGIDPRNDLTGSSMLDIIQEITVNGKDLKIVATHGFKPVNIKGLNFEKLASSREVTLYHVNTSKTIEEIKSILIGG